MQSLDTTIPGIDNGETYSWNNNLEDSYQADGDNTQEGSVTSRTVSWEEGKETLTGQLMKLSNRAIDATRELESGVLTTPLMVNSPVVNEAYVAANALVCIINSIPLAGRIYGSSQPLSRNEGDPQLPTEISPIFLALASHQHVLALFRAVCDCIRRSLRSIAHGPEPPQQFLHSAGSSHAQFTMVLQLILHLLNRIGRSLRIGDPKTTDQQELVFGSERSEESGGLEGIVDSAQAVLRNLPDEHVKLGKLIQELQACVEEGAHI
ncbi:hypothetical protein F5Y03DRAFT_398955 [Xylaria venustula]|nr:hypothetical protein F5Y03DRAFT_398955 [Xylaria venustula]